MARSHSAAHSNVTARSDPTALSPNPTRSNATVRSTDAARSHQTGCSNVAARSVVTVRSGISALSASAARSDRTVRSRRTAHSLIRYTRWIRLAPQTQCSQICRLARTIRYSRGIRLTQPTASSGLGFRGRGRDAPARRASAASCRSAADRRRPASGSGKS